MFLIRPRSLLVYHVFTAPNGFHAQGKTNQSAVDPMSTFCLQGTSRRFYNSVTADEIVR